MPDTSLHEIAAAFRNVDTGRVGALEALLAMTPETITLTFFVAGERIVLTVPQSDRTAPLRAAVRRAYPPVPAR